MNRKKQIFFIFIIFFFEFAYASGSNDNIAEIKKINTIQAAKIKDLAKKNINCIIKRASVLRKTH